MSEIPNIIVFNHNDNDGIFSAFLIKFAFDKNLFDSDYEKNVTCITCAYTKKFNLDFFKEQVLEYYVEGSENYVFMVDYAISGNNNQDMIKFNEWLKTKDCKFYWIDHHITAINNLSNYTFNGLQKSGDAGVLNVWKFLTNEFNTKLNEHFHEDIIKNEIPKAIQLVNDHDIWNRNGKFNWDNEVMPFKLFINSLENELNNNQSELIDNLFNFMMIPEKVQEAINIGKYINKYNISKYKRDASRNIFKAEWLDYSCLVINGSDDGSIPFEYYLDYKDFDLYISYRYTGKSFVYGIYTTKSYINVGEIAKMYLNGGGHKGAAGGETKHLIDFTKICD
jgi:oligoribonuclease NrnB/cAMP/cGMP phosphodiesterase (DHH superfamily)